MQEPFSRVPEDEIYKALRERVAWLTIGVGIRNRGEWGTGVPIKIGVNHLILTAGHVIEGVSAEDLRFTYRTDDELITVSHPKEIKGGGNRNEKFNVEQSLPVIKTTAIDPENMDIGLILLNTARKLEFENIQFHEINNFNGQTPTKLDVVTIAGFAQELASSMKKEDTQHIYMRLNIEHPALIAPPEDIPPFDSSIHFFLQFPQEELRPGDLLIDKLKGISGCGVWQPIKPLADEVWRIKPELIGIQHRVLPERRVFKCTKIEIILREVRKFISE